MSGRAGTRHFGVAVVLSPVLHALLAGLMVAMPAMSDNPQREGGRWSRASLAGEPMFLVSEPPSPPPSPTAPNQMVADEKPQPSPEPPKAEPLRLGIEKSSSLSLTWLGFDDPTEHQAPKSVVEQAALARMLMAPAAVDAPPSPEQAQPAAMPELAKPTDAPESAARAPAAKPAAPPPPAGANGDPEEHAPPGKQGEEKGAGAEKESHDPAAGKQQPQEHATEPASGPDAAAHGAEDKPRANAADGMAEQRPAPGPESVESPRKAPDSKRPDAKETPDAEASGAEPASSAASQPKAPSGAAEPLRQPPMAPSVKAPPGPIPAKDAQLSDKEADATSLREPLEIRPGRPAAGQGLDITTRRPVFSRYTLVSALPTNPTLRVTFNRDGKVSKVVVVKSSGYPNVDEPVLDAVYSWTAKGKPIAELKGKNGEAGVTITVRIILR